MVTPYLTVIGFVLAIFFPLYIPVAITVAPYIGRAARRTVDGVKGIALSQRMSPTVVGRQRAAVSPAM